MLRVRARYYSFEAANVRQEHEYHVWEQVALPPDKVLLPGVITHSTDLIEHPALVSERIQRFAKLVGPDRVIASAAVDSGHARIRRSPGPSSTHCPLAPTWRVGRSASEPLHRPAGAAHAPSEMALRARSAARRRGRIPRDSRGR